jgi:CheY-like chemotaxis protein
VKSALNKGSVFIVTLKNISIASAYSEEEIMAESEIQEVQNIVFSPSTILLVEDIESNRTIIKGFLEPYPFTILEATNGIEAFELAVKYRPDLILMDIQMNLMDGFESASLIRKKIPKDKCPILALTALTLKTNKKEQIDLFDGVIQKPVSRQKLITILTKYLLFTSTVKETVALESKQVIIENLTPDQLEKLKTYFQPKIEQLIHRMPINTILKFAEELNTFGSENHIEPLIEYSRELIMATHSFDTNLIEMQLNKFENLISNFKTAE